MEVCLIVYLTDFDLETAKEGGQLGDAGLQQGHDLGVVEVSGSIEGRVSVVVAVQGIGPGLQQEADAGRVALLGRDVEGRASLLRWQVDLGALLQQESHDLEMAILRCHEQRAIAFIVSQVDLGPVLQQRCHSLELATD